MLFLAREPLNSRKLSQYANLADGTEARTLIRQLNGFYDSSGRAFRVEEMAGGFRLMTRPQFASWLRRLAHVPTEVRLSAPALETLAVVAYRQPVLKASIEAVRGVSCGEVLRQLMERDLVRIVGRSEELGRPYLYGPTRRFLEVFGLRSLDDLPRVEATQAVERECGPNGADHFRNDSLAVEETTDRYSQFQPEKENVAVTVTFQDNPTEEQTAPWREMTVSAAAAAPAVAAEEDEDLDDFEDEDYEDEDLEEDEDYDEEDDLEDEEWEYEEDAEEEDAEEEFDDEWEEVEDEEYEDDEDLDDDDWDEDEDEDWGEE